MTVACGEVVAMFVRPGRLRALLGIPAKELQDSVVSLDEIRGPSASILALRLADAASAQERLDILQAELWRRCEGSAHDDGVAMAICGHIERTKGKVQVRALVERSGYSHRALLGRFDGWIGLSPKRYVRVTRVRRAAGMLGDGRMGDSSQIATECGFCDQAHMIHEFQDLVGLTPANFMSLRRTFAPVGDAASGRCALPVREHALYSSIGLLTH